MRGKDDAGGWLARGELQIGGREDDEGERVYGGDEENEEDEGTQSSSFQWGDSHIRQGKQPVIRTV